MKLSMKVTYPLLLSGLVLASFGAQATGKYNGQDRGKPVMPSVVNAKVQSECSGCHIAYPPGLLPAASWQKVMDGLDQHFGVDASLPAADRQSITDYLVKYASNRWTANAAPLRITDGEWYKVKHIRSGKVTEAIVKRESVKSKSNCQACHSGAEKGQFDERSVKIPK